MKGVQSRRLLPLLSHEGLENTPIEEQKMKKQQLLDKLEQAWTDLIQSYAGLSDEQLTRPGVTGGWSVKDILAHVTTWEEEALKYLPSILLGEKPPRYKDLYGGIDSFNAYMSAKKQALPLSDILSQLNDTHRRLIDLIQSAPDDQIATETPFRRRVRLDTYSHYPIHSSAIRAWRERLAL
jgi:hypothetical protein